MYWKYGIGIEQADLHPTGHHHYNVARTRLTGAEGVNYESVVRMHLGWIDETAVGRLLFRAIAREVLSQPSTNLAKFKTPVEAGAPTHGVLVQPYVKGDCNSEENYSVVSYSPYMAFLPCAAEDMHTVTQNRASYPWQVLCHELVHAFRDASGFGYSTPLHGGLRRYQNTEEFIAILVTNIFISDPTNRRADHLRPRQDHKGHHQLEKYLSNSLDFYQSSADTFAQVQQFCTDNKWFTKHLAEVKSDFNPITVYYHDREKARKKSQGAVAAVRDIL